MLTLIQFTACAPLVRVKHWFILGKKKNIFLKIPFIQPVEFDEGSHVKHKLIIMIEKSLWSVFPELSINMDYFSF